MDTRIANVQRASAKVSWLRYVWQHVPSVPSGNVGEYGSGVGVDLVLSDSACLH